jgi:hypothetical protein
VGTLHESDLRSLDRARMYTIFKPLDVDERLPREQLMASRRFRTLGRWELAGAIWLPALAVIMTVGGWTQLPSAVSLAAVGVTFLALLAFAVAGDRILRLK